MGLFDTIKNAIFGHTTAAPAPAQTTTTPAANTGAAAPLPNVDSRTGMVAPQ